MPKTKIPNELQELADELNLNLGGEETDDLDELIEWVRHEIGEARSEVARDFDDMEAKLDDIVVEETTE